MALRFSASDFFSGATSLMRMNSSRAGAASVSVALAASALLRSVRAAPAARSAAMISLQPVIAAGEVAGLRGDRGSVCCAPPWPD